MTLSDVSIKNPVFAWMLMIGLIFFGSLAFFKLGVSQMPDVDFPIVNIKVQYDGASPEVMEVDVVDVIEDAIMTVQGIKKVSSTSRNEFASITIEFELDTNIDDAMQEVESKIAQVQALLPVGIETPIIEKINPEDQPILWISVSSDEWSARKISQYARDTLKPQFQTVKGVSEILLGGYLEPNLRVWVDREKLFKYELTIEDVLNAIRSEHIEIPAGRIETKEKEYNLRFYGEAPTPEEFNDILILQRGGAPIFQPIRMGDVAKAVPGLAEVRSISRVNQKAALGLGIKKLRGTNEVEVSRAIKKKLKNLESSLPPGIVLRVNYDGTKFIEESTSELSFNLLLSALLTAVVCLMFLGSLRSAFNIILAIPTSIVGTFVIIKLLGFTLNTFTLLALILSIGIVVDDAIMVLENIIRHQEMGKSKLKAAIDGAREITPAAVATTIAIIAIFLPIIFMEGIVGKFLFQFGVTMSVAVLLSLLEALTLTPMRAASFVSVAQHSGKITKIIDRVFEKLEKIYTQALAFSLSHRWKIIFLALVIFVASFGSVVFIRKEFVPSQDQSSFLMQLKTPLGSSIYFTDEKVKRVEEIIMQQPEVVTYYTAIGGFDGGEVNTAIFFVTLKPADERPIDPSLNHPATQLEIMDRVRTKLSGIKDLEVFIQDLSASAFSAQSNSPIEFSIRGADFSKLADISQQIIDQMKSAKSKIDSKNVPTYTDINTNYLFGQPEIQFIPNRKIAQQRGVSLTSIGKTIGSLIGGIRSGKFNENGRRNDIRIKAIEGSIDPESVLKNILVRNIHGELVNLEDLVDVKSKKTLQSITRQDRERAITINSNISSGVSLDQALLNVEKIAKQILPEGYRIVFSGTAEAFNESFANLLFILVIGVVVAYMVLASQYNSFLHPITVLLALPFSISGAFVALLLTDNSLNIYSFIGLILLMGIVKKNSIMLVDFANQSRTKGLNVRDALLTACPIRLRPILMTSFATIAGAIPPALALGPGSETNVPMSIVVIGGVFLSTFLTLLVVPCAYSLFSRLERMPLDHAKNIETLFHQ